MSDDPFESTKCEGSVFDTWELGAALLGSAYNFQVRVKLPSEDASRPVKGCNIGNCRDAVAMYLTLGEPGEGMDADGFVTSGKTHE